MSSQYTLFAPFALRSVAAVALLPLLLIGCKGDDDAAPDDPIQDSGDVVTMPVIESLSPDRGVVGTEVTITGLDFGAAEDALSVTLGDSELEIVSFSAEQLVVSIPEGTTTGEVVVTRDDLQSNPAPFVVSGLFATPVDPDRVVLDNIGALYPTDQLIAQFADTDSRESVELALDSAGLGLIGWLPSIHLALVELPTDAAEDMSGWSSTLQGLGARAVLPNFGSASEEFWEGETDLEKLATDDPGNASEYERVRMQEAWDFINAGIDDGSIMMRPVRVGVLESGFDHDHDEFAGYFSTDPEDNPSGLGLTMSGPDLDPPASDRNANHGTRVASIIGGLNNGAGANGFLTGVVQTDAFITVRAEPRSNAWDMQTKVSDAFANGDSSGEIAFLFNELAGAEFLAELPHVKVVNMSYGLQVAGSPTVQGLPFSSNRPTISADAMRVVQGLYDSWMSAYPDVLFVASAGNTAIDAADHAPGGTPDVENLVSVGGVDDNADWWGFTSGGVATGSCYGDTVDIAAVSSGVWLPDDHTASGYSTGGGTSYAAPMVAGTAALMAAVNPTLDGAELKNILVASGAPLDAGDNALSLSDGSTGTFTWSGRYLNAEAAVMAAAGQLESTSDAPQNGSVNGVVAQDFTDSGGSLIFNLTITDLDGQPVQSTLAAEEFIIEDLQMELIENPNLVDIVVDDSEVTDITFQDAEADYAYVSMVLDQSCSMEDNDPDGLRVEAGSVLVDEVLDESADLDQLALATFPRNEGYGPFTQLDLWENFGNEAEAFHDSLGQLYGAEFGGTPLYDGIIEMAEYQHEVIQNDGAEPARAMVVMTDGEDTDSGSDYLDASDAALSYGIPLYIVGLGENLDFEELQDLAVSTGGTFAPASSAELLESVFRSLANAVHGSINLGTQVDLHAASGTMQDNALYSVSGRVAYIGGGAPVLIPFDFQVYLGNL